MKRIIRIFLASSIVEFSNERMGIENFIRNISDKFEENYDVKIQPLLCENFDDAYSKIRKQEEYNEKIRNSDLCFFIFFTKAGEYTREEFEVARKKFEETGKPKIYTYFKVIKDETAEQSLYDFMDELDKIFGHYYGTFEHIDTVKLRILLNLKLQEMDFLEIKVDGDTCVVDGKKTLSLENVSEFANNSIFQELKAELYEIEDSYFNLKTKYTKDECSQNEEREYIEIASKRQNLIDAIEDIQKNIFNMSFRMCQDEARGEITLRQKEAYRLFEAGDLEGANNILNFAEIENDYLRDIAIMESNMRKRSEIFIRETKTKIDILKTMTKLATRFTEIEELYDKLLLVILKFDIEIDTLFDYGGFLYEQNRYNKALEVGKQLEKNYINHKNKFDDTNKAHFYHGMATLCADLYSKKAEAEKYYIKSIEICEKLAENNPQNFKAYLAKIYNDVAIYYKDYGQHRKAEKYYLLAIEIYEKFLEKNCLEDFSELADSYNNIGVFYYIQGQFEKTEKYYLMAIEIRKKLVEFNPEFSTDLADSYNNIGVFYKNRGCLEKAEKYYLMAIDMRKKLAEENPVRFNHYLANSYNNMAILCKILGRYEKAERYYLSAIEIYEMLVGVDPERFNYDLANSYNNAGNFYGGQNQSHKAEEYYLSAIEIYETLARVSPKRFNHDLARIYNNIGNLYGKNNNAVKADKYYLSAIEIREKLIKVNPDRFTYDLAQSYLNYAIFTQEEKYFQKALTLAKTKPDNLHCKQIINALEGE